MWDPSGRKATANRNTKKCFDACCMNVPKWYLLHGLKFGFSLTLLAQKKKPCCCNTACGRNVFATLHRKKRCFGNKMLWKLIHCSNNYSQVIFPWEVPFNKWLTYEHIFLVYFRHLAPQLLHNKEQQLQSALIKYLCICSWICLACYKSDLLDMRVGEGESI